MHTSNERYRFRCSDLVKGCSWEATADSKEELLKKIEQHGKERHDMPGIDPGTRQQVENVITKQAA
ncbi:MAG TPA: DUF1059 domain-containing protein [Terriglobales bacterium]